MNYYTKAELDELGYKFACNFNFQSQGQRPALDTLFFMQGIQKNAKVRDWLEHVIEKSRILGFPEIPHTVINKHQSVNVTFHFKSALQSVLFTEMANGFSQKGPFIGSIVMPSDQPLEKMDAYVQAVKAGCDRLGVECRFQPVDHFKTNLLFRIQADHALFIDEIPKIIEEVNSTWNEVQKNLHQAGYPDGFFISNSNPCNLAATVIDQAKKLNLNH